jgi:hypothetical protein
MLECMHNSIRPFLSTDTTTKEFNGISWEQYPSEIAPRGFKNAVHLAIAIVP